MDFCGTQTLLTNRCYLRKLTAEDYMQLYENVFQMKKFPDICHGIYTNHLRKQRII